MVAVVFCACCAVLARNPLPPLPALRSGAMPHLFLGERLSVCRIEIVGTSSLAAGDNGDIMVWATLDNDHMEFLEAGTLFELRNGFMDAWANCRVTEILEVRTDAATELAS